MPGSVNLLKMRATGLICWKNVPVVDVEGAIPAGGIVWGSSSRCFADMRCDIGCILALSLYLSSINFGLDDLGPLLLTVASSKVYLRSAVSIEGLLAVAHRGRVELVIELLNIWTCFVDVRGRVSVIVRLDVWSYLLSYRQVGFADGGGALCEPGSGRGASEDRSDDGVPG